MIAEFDMPTTGYGAKISKHNTIKEIGRMSYNVDFKNIETVAYVEALILNQDPEQLASKNKIEKNFPGGIDAAKRLQRTNILQRHSVWNQLQSMLDSENISEYNAPWIKATAPEMLNDHSVAYSSEGVKIGCVEVSLAELEEMVKECKG
jgi:aspartyl-tRNA synthetase